MQQYSIMNYTGKNKWTIYRLR